MDPVENDLLTSRISRRTLLRATIGAATIPGAAALLSACGRGTAPSSERSPLASPDRPVTLPVRPRSVIASELPIERGATLRVYEWRKYLSPSVLDAFVQRYRRYDVRYEVTSFENREESLAVVHRPTADFDVFFPTIDALAGLVAEDVLQPLNHDYLPNLANVWPQFRGTGPFYDVGPRYSVPYTVFSSGVGWRADLVRTADAPDVASDPFGIFWNARYRGKVGIYDAYRDALGLALQHVGVGDVNAASPSSLSAAGDALIAMAGEVDVRATADGAYEGLPQGEFAVHQAWSGDALSARRFGGDRRGAALLRYWWPTDGRGVVGCDLVAIPTRARNPVLAHAFLNHLLDVDVSLRNFSWNGYQPPITAATPDVLLGMRSGIGRVVPDRLRPALLSPEEFDRSQMLLPLPPILEARWVQQWVRFTAALGATGSRPPASSPP